MKSVYTFKVHNEEKTIIIGIVSWSWKDAQQILIEKSNTIDGFSGFNRGEQFEYIQ